MPLPQQPPVQLRDTPPLSSAEDVSLLVPPPRTPLPERINLMRRSLAEASLLDAVYGAAAHSAFMPNCKDAIRVASPISESDFSSPESSPRELKRYSYLKLLTRELVERETAHSRLENYVSSGFVAPFPRLLVNKSFATSAPGVAMRLKSDLLDFDLELMSVIEDYYKHPAIDFLDRCRRNRLRSLVHAHLFRQTTVQFPFVCIHKNRGLIDIAGATRRVICALKGKCQTCFTAPNECDASLPTPSFETEKNSSAAKLSCLHLKNIDPDFYKENIVMLQELENYFGDEILVIECPSTDEEFQRTLIAVYPSIKFHLWQELAELLMVIKSRAIVKLLLQNLDCNIRSQNFKEADLGPASRQTKLQTTLSAPSLSPPLSVGTKTEDKRDSKHQLSHDESNTYEERERNIKGSLEKLSIENLNKTLGSLTLEKAKTNTPDAHTHLHEDEIAKAAAKIQVNEKRRRFLQVMSLYNGQFVLPEKMKSIQFTNLLGDGTYGYVMSGVMPTILSNKTDYREVAVKFVTKSKIPDTSWASPANKSAQRLPMEIVVLQRVNHQNLLKMIDYAEDDEFFYIITDLHGSPWMKATTPEKVESENDNQLSSGFNNSSVASLMSLDCSLLALLRQRPSCDLFECIDAHTEFSEDTVRKIFRQIVHAVQYLHSNGIVHSDIKDENIAIDTNYEIKLIDFGSASFIAGVDDPPLKAFFGTMDFASPEVIKEEPYRGPETEIWALGVLLYLLVFRRVPFKSKEEILFCSPSICQETKAKFENGNEIVSIIQNLLTKDWHKRPHINQVVAYPWLQ